MMLPADMTGIEEFRRLVAEYCRRFCHSFVVHDLHTRESWAPMPVSDKPGCYALYTATGQLLYIGKASNSRKIGHRLYHHLTQSQAAWVPSVSFVQIVEVSEPFEAPSLEEYLIRELQPPHNDRGIRRTGTQPSPN